VRKRRPIIDIDRIGGVVLGFLFIALVIVICAMLVYHEGASHLSYMNGA
jgi:hypothetical protein